MNQATLVKSNRTENLLVHVQEMMATHPLSPLEDEVFLVQSNGIGQWLRHQLAGSAESPAGIAMAIQTLLPAQFQWLLYRMFRSDLPGLGETAFDRDPLVWRCMRILPTVLPQEEFSEVRAPLGDPARESEYLPRLYGLSQEAADLFDKYQQYRPEWLERWAWEDEKPDDPQQHWQAILWRAIVQSLTEAELGTWRGEVHRSVLARLDEIAESGGDDAITRHLPRRITVFGVSSLPPQIIELLHHLSRLIPVTFALVAPAESGASTSPHRLLQSWGVQGREFTELLTEEFSTPPHVPLVTHDILTLPEEDSALPQLQRTLISGQPFSGSNDGTITISSAHSALREVEVLQDLIIDALQQDHTLMPRDILVMVPEITEFAPVVSAIFGSIERDDPRYVPVRIADREVLRSPILTAIPMIFALLGGRVTTRQIMDLLSLAPVARRFGLQDEDLDRIQDEILSAGIRWGVNGKARAGFSVSETWEENTWNFGIDRLILGYATGTEVPWQNVLPAEATGSDSTERIGGLWSLVQSVESTIGLLADLYTPAQWVQQIETLLALWFTPEGPEETGQYEHVVTQLHRWQLLCNAAGFVSPLPADVVLEGWLPKDPPTRLTQPFLSGAVTVATLMPMRAVPFRHVFLLGMNEASYPRRVQTKNTDLTQRPGAARKGDRSRRDDDRYLFLEALLAVRERLHMSWSGRDIRTNNPLPPSVLVGQVLDILGPAIPVVEHPLHPFSGLYHRGPRLFTYAREWNNPVQDAPPPGALDVSSPEDHTVTMSLREVQKFLRNPLQGYFEDILHAYLNVELEQVPEDEPFELTGLERWNARAQLMTPAADPAETLHHLQLAGKSPLGPLGATVQEELLGEAQLSQALCERALERIQGEQEISIPVEFTRAHRGQSIQIRDEINHILVNPSGERFHIVRHPSIVGSYKEGLRPFWRYWVTHVAAQLAGAEVETTIVTWDKIFAFLPLEPAAAERTMIDILDFVAIARTEPVPLPETVGCAWAKAGGYERQDAAMNAVRDAFGSLSDRYITRLYPDPEVLGEDETLLHWAHRLYVPCFESITERPFG